MPRLPFRRAGRAAAAALALLALTLPPDALRGALASAAASVFEATPFVLGAAFLPKRLARLAPLLACGCGGPLPGALAPAAIGLCWIAFGPWVALARTAAALVAVRLVRRPAGLEDERADPLEALASVAACGFTGTLLAGWLSRTTIAAPFGILGGAAAGALLPCPVASLALAAAIGGPSRWAAAGLLLTAGLVRAPRAPARSCPGAHRTARAAYAGVAVACAYVWCLDGHGFLNPRLIALPFCGALLAATSAIRHQRSAIRYGWLVPAVLIASLIAGSPLPTQTATTLPLGLYPGASLDFTGIVGNRGTRVSRATIVCCRADATMLSVSLAQPLRLPDGVWVHVRGTMKATRTGLRLAVASASFIRAPVDPYAYM
jgi:hypothetical protein